MGSSIYRKTICPLDCPDACAIVARIKDGRVVSLQGDLEHPYTNGFICRKMRRYPERVYSEQRILYPMLRDGAKGSGSFHRVSWGQAFALMADRFRQIIDNFGGEAILPYSYAGNMGLLSRYGGYPLFHKLGMSRLLGTICSSAAGSGWDKQCGNLPGCPPENCLDSELIVCWGINAKITNVHFWRLVVAARKNGAKLLVIDPYRNDTGRLADHYFSVRPGGDVPLAFGLMKYLVAKGAFDAGFIERYTTGFTEFSAMVTSLSWRDLEEDSGLRQVQIEELAQILVANPRTFLRMGIGMTRNRRGGMAVRAVASLAAMLGLFGGGAGKGMLLTSRGFRGDSSKITRPELAPDGLRSINMVQLGQALTANAPPIYGLIVYNTNPACVNPDGAMVRKGLLREDLFTVVHEQMMTPTAKYADLLLPATTFLENRDLYTGYGQFYLQVTDPVIAPLGEAKANFDLWREFAEYLSLNESPFADSIDERLLPYLETLAGVPETCTPQDILAGKRVHSTFSCGDGNVLARIGSKFHFASKDLDIYPSSACVTTRGESDDADLLARFPLHLLAPPHPDLLNSTFGERYPGKTGELIIHPDDAKSRGVKEGDLVRISNLRGETCRVARISTDTRPGTVVAEGIFWPVADDSPGINDLTSQKLTDMGGGTTLHESLVDVVPL